MQTLDALFGHNHISVHKFGGTSMASIHAMRHSAEVVLRAQGPLIVVVSAAATVTRSLMHLSHQATSQAEKKRLLADITHIHETMLDALTAPERIRNPVEALLQEASDLTQLLQQERKPSGVDALLSLGERLSSLVFSALLQDLGREAVCFDVREVMRTSDHFGEAEPLLPEIKARARSLLLPLAQQKVVVTQGYIGSTLSGMTTTLGKESSDYSAALLAEAVGAQHFAIWTDIPGVFTTDPKITAAAHPIKIMSMHNALALTEAGAKVLHPRTMLPALRAGMSFFVGSSQGLTGGTWVRNVKENPRAADVIAINLRPSQILLSFDLTGALPFSRAAQSQIEAMLSERDLKPVFAYSDPLSTEILLDDSLREFRRESLLNEALKQNLQTLAPCHIETDLQLIAIIGNRLDQHAGLRQILAEFINHYKIRVLSFGMSTHALFILVYEDITLAQKLVITLHEELFP